MGGGRRRGALLLHVSWTGVGTGLRLRDSASAAILLALGGHEIPPPLLQTRLSLLGTPALLLLCGFLHKHTHTHTTHINKVNKDRQVELGQIQGRQYLRR